MNTLENESKDNFFKSGFIAVIGKPNVGKSTLVNVIVGRKVSAVSSKPNTTRNRITGIKTLEDAQLIFMDTPGIHKAKGKLGKNMVDTAYSALSDCDLILMVIDVNKAFDKGDRVILSSLPKPAIVALNKIDTVKKERILEVMELSKDFEDKIKELVPVSALKYEGVCELIEVIKKHLPVGHKYFPDDMYTDQPERFLCAEIIREKIFEYTREEIPYKTAVKIEGFEEDQQRNLIRIFAYIYVERESHKSIIIGKGGSMLKKIGSKAREEIERLLGLKVYLELWVKVKEKWTQKDYYLRELGYI